MDEETAVYGFVSELSLDPVQVDATTESSSQEEVIVDVLLSKCDINTKNKEGKTPLMVAIERGNKILVEELITKGANVNSEKLSNGAHLNHFDDHGFVMNQISQTPLQLAIAMNYESILDKLIEAGADVNIANSKFGSPIEVALAAGNLKIARKLLVNGASLCPLGVISSLVKCDKKHFLILIDFVLENKFNINAKGYKGWSLLHVAIIRQNLKGVMKLLKKGANVNSKDSCRGDTPLHVAARGTNYQIVKLLLEYKSDVNVTNRSSESVLCIAVRRNRKGIIRLLINAGAEISSELFKWQIFRGPLKQVTSYMFCARLMSKAKVPINVTQSDVMLYHLRNYLTIFDMCMDFEISDMTLKKFGKISLYNILSECHDPIFASNSVMKAYVKSDTLQRSFPLYAKLLRRKFKEGVKRNLLLDGISLSVRIVQDLNVSHIVLPNEMSRKVLVYLADCDLLNVKRAFNVIDQQ